MNNDSEKNVKKQTSGGASLFQALFHQKTVGKFSIELNLVAGIPLQ
jgi:hypothetical protein